MADFETSTAVAAEFADPTCEPVDGAMAANADDGATTLQGLLSEENEEDMPDWLLGTERCIELSEVAGEGGGRATRIRNYEHFFGPLAPFVWLHRGRHIQRGFTAFNHDLGCVLEPRTCGAAD